MFSLNEACALARETDVAAALAALERYLADASGPERFRKSRNSPDARQEREGYGGLATLGIPAAILPESHGGSGLAAAAVALLGERFGRALAREPFVETMVLPGALALALDHRATAEAMAGGGIHAVAWQESAFERPGRGALAAALQGDGGRFRLAGAKRFVAGARAADVLLVLAQAGGEPVLVRVETATPGIERCDKVLADGTCWSDVRFDCALAADAVLARGPAALAALRRAIDLANLALAGQLYGLQSRILEMTLDYLATRVQFDQPIGSFQALQHRAVDLYTHAQIARYLIGEAVDALAQGADAAALEVYASRAKARAADSGHRIAREGIQMHGGIGFSDEYDLGLYVKRLLVLSAWLGNADWHRRRLAMLMPLDQAGVE